MQQMKLMAFWSFVTLVLVTIPTQVRADAFTVTITTPAAGAKLAANGTVTVEGRVGPTPPFTGGGAATITVKIKNTVSGGSTLKNGGMVTVPSSGTTGYSVANCTVPDGLSGDNLLITVDISTAVQGSEATQNNTIQ